MSAAIGIALGVGLGLSSGLAAIFIATGSFVLKVPDASAFEENEDAVEALKRTVAKLAEQDESEIKLILPCDKARRLEDLDWSVLAGTTEPTEPTETEPGSHGLRKRRLQESLGVCFQISVEGEEASSNVCQRLSGFSSDDAQRILAEELSDIPGTSGVNVISFSASPNPIASNPNQNAGPADFFDPTQAGISLGAAPPPLTA